MLVLLAASGTLIPSLRAQGLTATASGGEEWISRFQPLVVLLSRPPAAGERLGVVIRSTDVSDLCVVHGDTLLYEPYVLPLPSGESTVAVYTITPEGAWNSSGTFPIRVLTSGGLERSVVSPSLTLAASGQPASNRAPEEPAAGRTTFQELNSQFSLRADGERGGFQFAASLALVGVSFRQEALRFSERKDDASKIDLAGYLLETRTGATSFSVGHIAHGRQRHLLNSFASRGLSLSTALAPFADVSAAVLNATSIVGWDNPVGLAHPEHRIQSGTLGLEFIPSAPGTLRVEASYVHASQLPLAGFNQGQITDAEKSEGVGLRVQVSDPDHVVSLDAGYASVRFTNPPDPLLSQGFEVVPVSPAVRQARYADIAWDVLGGESFLATLPVRLNIAFRHERVDPLYRAVGASVRPDLLQNSIEMHGGFGLLHVDLLHLRSEDNLADIPSILKSKTRQTGVTVAIPLAERAPLLPALTYGLNATHQFGAGTPVNSDFTPDRVPDQLTTSHTAGIEWQGYGMRVAWRAGLTLLDNRQPGRENADAVNRTQGLNVSVAPLSTVVVGVDGSLESAEDLENSTVIRTRRVGASISGQPFLGAGLNLAASLSTTKPGNGSAAQKQASCTVEASYAFDLSSAFVFSWRGQIFVRCTWNELSSRDFVFGLNAYRRSWVLQTGVSFTMF